mgnify:CR=1 FL=1
MRRRLVRGRRVDRDLREQVDFIAVDRPAVARRYLIAVEDAFERLRRMPELGVRRPFKRAGLQGGPYLAGTEAAVEVIRVLHSARDVPRVLKRS